MHNMTKETILIGSDPSGFTLKAVSYTHLTLPTIA